MTLATLASPLFMSRAAGAFALTAGMLPENGSFGSARTVVANQVLVRKMATGEVHGDGPQRGLVPQADAVDDVQFPLGEAGVASGALGCRFQRAFHGTGF